MIALKEAGVPDDEVAQQFKSSKPKTPLVHDHVYMSLAKMYEIAKERKIRHEFKYHNPYPQIYVNDDPVVSISYAFWKNEVGNKRLVHKYHLDDAIYDQEVLADISKYIFTSGLPEMGLMCGIEQLYGWNGPPDTKKVIQKTKEWVQSKFEPKYNGSSELFYKHFREGIRNTLRWRSGKIPMTTTAETFCTNIADTGTSGSAYDPGGARVDIEVEGIKVKVRNNKFNKSAALSVANKLKRLFSNTRQKANVSVKVEVKPKERLIVASDFNTSLKMRFVDLWIDQWMRGNKNSTLWMNNEQLTQMWIDFAEEDGWNAPLDQTEWDHHINKIMNLIAIDEITNLIFDHATDNEELLIVMGSITFALSGGKIYVVSPTGERTELDYESGILSGWQWTAFLNSLINCAEMFVAEKWCTEHGLSVFKKLFNVQGDDVLLRFKTVYECVMIVFALRSFGFLIHPKKTFFSRNHNEYLRKYYKDNEINGYACRMIPTLLWTYPGSMGTTILEKLTSFCSKWVKFGQRCHWAKGKTIHHIRSDLRGAKVAHALVEQYLTTSKVRGGPGLIEGPDYTFNQIGHDLEVRVDVNAVGYREFKQRFGVDQSRELESWFLKVATLPNEVKGIPIYSDLTLDVQPAPSIQPLAFVIEKDMEVPNTPLNPLFPRNTLFGKSDRFMAEAFPSIDSFKKQSHAPKSWIYSMLLGQVKVVAPTVPGMSDEFSSLISAPYTASVKRAMYYKKGYDDKWLRLNKHFENVMPDVIRKRLPTLLMY